MLIDCLIKSTDLSELKEHYVYTFLGKGWDHHVVRLNNAGYETHHIKFAPDYIEEICKHDIQVTPICIGTGTKGKVLDAIANGLLVIGTWYALENIAVKHLESCIEYDEAKEFIKILKDIIVRRNYYENIALKGRKSILERHNQKLISEHLFRFMKE